MRTYLGSEVERQEFEKRWDTANSKDDKREFFFRSADEKIRKAEVCFLKFYPTVHVADTRNALVKEAR